MTLALINNQQPNVREVEADMLVYAVTSSISALRSAALESGVNRMLLRREIKQLELAADELNRAINVIK